VVSAQLLQTAGGDVDSFNGTQPQVIVEQPIPLGGQRRARMTHARRRTAQAEAEAELALEAASAEVRRAFVALLAHQRRVTILAAASEELEHAAAIVRGRTASGDRSRYDAVRIEVELQRVAVALLEAQSVQESASRALAALLGAPELRPVAVGELEAEGGATPRSPDEHPALVLARRELAAAEAAVTVAKREAIPVPVVSAGGAFTTRNYASAAYVGVEIPVPLFDRNQGRVAAARAEARVTEARRDATRVAIEAERRRATRLLAMRREALEAFEHGVYASVPELRQMAQEAYRGGASGVLELVDALRTQRELELDHVDYLEALKLAEVDVLVASGEARPAP
jgi:cobalt-zinc-cadmium efflux system outer membrane protein